MVEMLDDASRFIKNSQSTCTQNRLIRLFRPLQAKMTIRQVNGITVSSNSGAVWITHYGGRRLRFVSHLSIPPVPPIQLGFEIDDGENRSARFVGTIVSKKMKQTHFEYTLQLELDSDGEQKMDDLANPLREETLRATEKAVSSYTRLEQDESVEIFNLYI